MERCVDLAMVTHTGVDVWMSMTIPQLRDFYEATASVVKRQREAAEEARRG